MITRRLLLAGLVVALSADSHNGLTWLVPSSSRVLNGYVADGPTGVALARGDVTLLDSPFLGNMSRKLAYLEYLDQERLLRPFLLNYGQPSAAAPCGGWESPGSQVRGHTTGHLMTALALMYAQTGSSWARASGAHIVARLASLQARAASAGFHPGYLSAFPESQFDRLEAGHTVWSPYYMIHKYLAGLIDQYSLAGSSLALEVALRLGDWVCWRTGRLPYEQMQMVLETEFGGLPESLVNLYVLTGSVRYLDAAARFYHARVLDPLVRGDDQLAGVHANTTVPKVIWCARMGEVTGLPFYGDIARNFWDIVTSHHAYVIGGVSDHEHFQAPDAVASQLSDFTCENCVSYHMLRLTRLLFYEQPERTDLLDYYERVLYNQMLGEQDPTSPHGFDCYYTGLSAGTRKQQPLNYFPHGDPGVYATDYDTFTCDTATGLETPVRFTEMIYSHMPDGLSVNLFIPSQVRYSGVVLSLSAALPDSPVVRVSVVSGAGLFALRMRVPSWTSAVTSVLVNGVRVPVTASVPGWIVLRRRWSRGDVLEVTLPMALTVSPAPDNASVYALTYGPVVLAGTYPATSPSRGLASGAAGPDPGAGAALAPASGAALPVLDPASVQRAPGAALAFTARSAHGTVPLLPLSRVVHDRYTVYWRTA